MSEGRTMAKKAPASKKRVGVATAVKRHSESKGAKQIATALDLMKQATITRDQQALSRLRHPMYRLSDI